MVARVWRSHLARRTLRGSCCRPCKELGWTTGGSWEHRYACPPPGHEEHGDGGCKTGEAEKQEAENLLQSLKKQNLQCEPDKNNTPFIHRSLDLSKEIHFL